MKKILFVSYGAAHINMLLPVAQELKKKDYNIEFFALTMAIEKLKTTDFKYYTYKDFFYNEKVKKYGEKLIKELNTIKLDDADSISYLGQNFIELVQKYGERKAFELYNKSGRQIFEPYESMKKILTIINPDLVIATDSPRSEKCAIEASRELNIKSVALINLFAIRCIDWFKKNNFADKICVFSEDVKQYLVENGRNINDVVVTGNPAFDDLVNLKYEKELNGEFKVLWASQKEPKYFAEFDLEGDEELPLKIEDKLINIFKDKKNWKLLVRNHPNEEERTYPSFIEVCNEKKLIDILKEVDLIICCASTVGIEGLILDKDLITIDLSVLTATLPYSKFGYSLGINNLEEIDDAITQVYNSYSEEKTKKYNITDATKNVVNVVIDLIEAK